MQEWLGRLVAKRQTALQSAVEEEVGWMAVLREQRTEEGAAGGVTHQIRARLAARRRKLRELLSTWHAWGELHIGISGASLGEATGAAAAGATDGVAAELDEDEILRGRFPWDPCTDPQLASKEAVALQLHKVRAELARTEEELGFLRVDAHFIVRNVGYRIAVLKRRLLALSPDSGEAHLLYTRVMQLERQHEEALCAFRTKGWL